MGLITILFGAILLLVAGVLLFVTYLYLTHAKYFRDRGIPYAGPGYGRTFRFVSSKISLIEAEKELYWDSVKTKKPIVGFSDAFVNKAFFITDLDMARNIYVKDFEHFVDRRKFSTQKSNVIFTKMLIGMEGEQWKGMRSKLSPTFTTGKIRRMFGIFTKSSGRMCDYIKDIIGPSGGEIDIIEGYSKYAMDVIAGCAFGIDSKSFDCKPGEISQFEKMGQNLQLKFDAKVFVKFLFTLAVPKLADLLGIEAFDPTPLNYFSKVVQEVMNRRRETGERQDDFLQLMMDTQEGLLKAEENSKESLEVMTGTDSTESSKTTFHGDVSEKLTFDDDAITANCVLFLLAGFDTLQGLLIFAAYQLALNQDVQEKLYREVNKSVEASDGKLTYDGVNEMSYLDMYINETLRLYSPAARTERLCTKDYPVPGTNLVIEKGTLVGLPVTGVHLDSKYYENPTKFDPERFLPENKSKRHPYSFAPFGHGNRNCIGMRFALVEAKAVLASLVNNFKFEPCFKTIIPMKYGNTTSLRPMDGKMWLKLTPRN